MNPILKNGKDLGSIDSYRPISLASAICKLPVWLIANTLQHFL